MPVAVPMGGEPRGGDEVVRAAVTTTVSSGRRKQKQPCSPKTPLPSRAAGAVPSTPSAASWSRQAAGDSPSGSTSTTTTNSPPAPSTTWTLYDNPSFCSSHFYPDLQHRHRRRHHHRKPIGATTPEKPSLGTVLERERAMVALERERAMREEAEAMAEAFRVELARERKRREEAEERARKAEEEGTRWKEEVERVQGEVRAAREAWAVLEKRVRAEMAEAMGRFEEERRRLQMQVRPAAACGRDSATQCDRSKDHQQHQQLHKVQQHQAASPLGTTTPAPPHPLTPSQTPKQRPQQQHQPRRDASPAPIENPHIRRGIIGFVEFPRVVGRSRAATTKPGVSGPPKLECQKAQLRVLLKGGGGGKVAPVAGFPSSAPPAHNLVM